MFVFLKHQIETPTDDFYYDRSRLHLCWHVELALKRTIERESYNEFDMIKCQYVSVFYLEQILKGAQKFNDLHLHIQP